MSNNAVVLTDIPNAGTDLEDYVAALYQATGYYIEKNLVERAPDEVLELDIVATYYHESQSSSMIVEAKGGNGVIQIYSKLLAGCSIFPKNEAHSLLRVAPRI